jgi:hypothetical protein
MVTGQCRLRRYSLSIAMKHKEDSWARSCLIQHSWGLKSGYIEMPGKERLGGSRAAELNQSLKESKKAPDRRAIMLSRRSSRRSVKRPEEAPHSRLVVAALVIWPIVIWRAIPSGPAIGQHSIAVLRSGLSPQTMNTCATG